jgi:hypothetical protein
VHSFDGPVRQLVGEAWKFQPSPSHLDLVERSRLYLVDVVRDEVVATIGTDRLLTLLGCRHVFTDAATIVAVLESQEWSRVAWAGRRANLRPVYARLRKRLHDTMFSLMGEGFYGFYLRASADQRREELERQERRLGALKHRKRAVG